mmetsp:Transcript_6603/g.13438  ORF Transcript_6603/g.13438 Transcript_6603/m.13438 type:complete len:324 (-) Transcript_6603:488-1459(-)
MFSTHANLEARVCRAALCGSKLDELPHSFRVDGDKWIVLQNALFQVFGNKCPDVVSGVAKRHLCQIIAAVGKKIGLLGNFVGCQRRTGNLNHCTNLEFAFLSPFLKYLFCHGSDESCLVLKFLDFSDQGHHNIWSGIDPLFDRIQCRLENGPHLHFNNGRLGNAKAAPTKSQHGVHLLGCLDLFLYFVYGYAQLGGQAGNNLFVLQWRKKFVKWWIQKPHGHRKTIHCFEDAFIIVTLKTKQLFQGLSLLFIVAQDQLAHLTDTLRLEKHVLRTTQANSIGTILSSFGGICWGVCVCQNINGARLVHPTHKGFQISRNGRRCN